MTKQEGIRLFNSIYPNFFETESVQNIPDKWLYEEMVLPLDEWESCQYNRKFDENVSFGYYRGDILAIKKAVEKVDENWPQYYTENQRIYCGYIEKEIASFCVITDLGVHDVNGKKVKVAGPGCVGTLPEYRDRGIGLTMVKQVTQILKKEGYDYSYIHYTGVASWYEKIGYKTSIRWTKKGIL